MPELVLLPADQRDDHPPRALLVEDDPDIQHLVDYLLTHAGFIVTATTHGREAIARARADEPDVVILDLGLPDLHGIEVCRILRTFTDAYIIIVTAAREESDRLLGLEAGADDYMVKPFSTRELTARIRAMFRRPRRPSSPAPGTEGPEALTVGDLRVELATREVHLAGRYVTLTRTEFDLLAVLASNPRRVWERHSLIRLVWKTDWVGDTHHLETHLANLRRKLRTAAPGAWVQAERGVGYRLIGRPAGVGGVRRRSGGSAS